VEVTSEFFSDQVGAMESLRSKLLHSIESTIGLRVVVRLVGPQTLQRSEGKARRVIDHRHLQPS
ncbi:MAG: phenylacetate--CoA ligase, partial [Candidatus Omnitrophica bacterium]|nr:phenylacetate--CoA ligase [Candidatus Omnitrophota bacterium]